MQNRKAFTLIELTVVMVAIGLIMVAVLAGNTLRKNAEVNGYITEVNKFTLSIRSFEDKYSDLPGDMSDAYDVFGSDCGTEGNCNGDSDGYVDFSAETPYSTIHMFMADMLDGTYTSSAYEYNFKIGAIGYLLDAGTDASYTPQSVNIIETRYSSGSVPFLTSYRAAQIDNKMDDGDAVNGFVTYHLDDSSCVTSSAYTSDDSTIACALIIELIR